jgi:LysM repeat protein
MQVFGLKVLFIYLLFSIQSGYSQSDKNPTDLIVPPVITDSSANHISIIDSILNFSKQYLGRPYRGGGKGPNSFDCSGFTSFVFSNFGIKLGSSSGDQAEQLPAVAKNEILPGDLVFFNGHRRGSRVGHVGLVVSKHENGTFDFIHSASSVGISISHSESNYYDRRYVSAGRVFTSDSLLANYKFNKQNTKTEPEISIQSEVYEPAKVIETTVKKTIPAKYHTVKSGETLSSIANKYGLSISQLKKKNNLKTDFLSLKQRLKIKDKQEIAVVEKQKPTVTTVLKTYSVKVAKVNNDTELIVAKLDFHTVKKGETLFSISKEYGLKVKDLIKINNLKTESILAGQRIKLTDDVKNDLVQETKTANKTIKAKPKTKTHTVKSGETLSEIAEKYNCTVRELKAWNGKSNNKLSLGEKLKIVI